MTLRKRPRFNGSADDHAATELLASIKPDPAAAEPPVPWRPPGERFADPRTWRGANDIGERFAGASDIGVMPGPETISAAVILAARPAPWRGAVNPPGSAPLDGYQPEPASFPALPPAPEPEPRDVLAAVPVTEPAVIGDDLKLPVIWCEMPGCIGFFLDEESAGFADARDRAADAGWRTDALGRLACPDCQQGRADYRTPQPVTWHHPGIPRRWHERGTLPSDETQERLTGAAEYARYVSRKRPDWAAAMAGATSRTAAS